MEALSRSIRRSGLAAEVQVIARGCFGLCNIAPNLYIEPDGIWYSRFTLKDVPVIVRQHLLNNRPVKRLIHYPDRLVPAKRKRRTPSGGNSRGKRNRSR